jgi:glutaminase
MSNPPLSRYVAIGLTALGLTFAALPAQISAKALKPAAIQKAIDDGYAQVKTVTEGKNADYIPALAEVDSNLFGVALVTTDGKTYTKGDIDALFSIQSISKVFTLALVLQESGAKPVMDGVGVDATGQVFNSIVAVEQYRGHQMNPLVNPGAIATTGMVKGTTDPEKWSKILKIHSDFAGRSLDVNQPVYKSEAETNQRNQAIAALMLAYGLVQDDPKRVTDVYTRQCAINVNAKDLAIMAGTLANGGKNPVTGKQVIAQEHVHHLLAVMATAGLYDDSGIWLFNVGLPAKSGVGGGIIAVSPGKFGIAAFSPPLDAAGNSVKAQRVIQAISNALGGNPLDPKPR